jgi:hypothetical protein
MERIVLAPDIYVNASVALGSPPEQVARRILDANRTPTKTSEWILARVQQMLRALPEFRDGAVEAQLALIRGLVEIVTLPDLPAEQWAPALIATARAAGARRVVTDHPDLLALGEDDGIEFMSSEAYLVESATPPPPPAHVSDRPKPKA